MSNPKDAYVSIDIETTGLSPTCCNIIEFAAIIDDWDTPVNQLSMFRRYIRHDFYYGEARALSMHSRIFAAIADGDDDVIDEKHLGGQFHDWLQEHLPLGFCRPVTAAGKNFASFDAQFLKHLPEFDGAFRHRVIDVGNLYWHPLTHGAKLPDMAECLRIAGLTATDEHTALGDAMDVVKLIRHHYGEEL